MNSGSQPGASIFKVGLGCLTSYFPRNAESNFLFMNPRRLISAICICANAFGLLLAGEVGAQNLGGPNPGTNAPGEFVTVNLSKFVTTVLSNAPQGNIWNSLPRGRQLLQGIPFQIDGKFEVTGIDGLKGGNEYIPTRVTGIPIGRKAEKLLLLHATGYTEKDGTPLANLVLHYANGSEQSLRIIYGVHVRNWYEERYEKKKSLFDPNTVVAWSGTEDDSDRNSVIRLQDRKSTRLNSSH